MRLRGGLPSGRPFEPSSALLPRGALVAIALAIALLRPAGAPSPASAQPPDPLVVLDQIGGVGTAVTVDGDLAFAVVGARVAIYDLSAPPPATPTLIARSAPLPATPDRLLAADGFVWTTLTIEGEATLVGLDVRLPEAPRLAVSVAGIAGNNLLAGAGGLLYTASWQEGLVVLDVREPALPTRVAAPEMDVPRMVATEGSRVVLATDEEILAYDVDPTTDPPTFMPLGTLPFLRLEAIDMEADRLFALQSGWNGSFLAVIDMTDPAAMRLSGAVELDRNAIDVSAMGDRAYVALHNSAGDVFGLATGGLAVVDASEPSRPLVVGSGMIESGASSVATAPGRALLNTYDLGTFVFDVTDPAKPLGKPFESGPADAESVALLGHHLFVADGPSRVLVYDTSQWPLRQVNDAQLARARVSGLAAADGMLYAATYGSGARDAEVRIIDAGDPMDLRETAALSHDDYTLDLDAAEGFLYLANKALVRVVDVRDPSAPREVATLDHPKVAWAIEARGDRLFVGGAGRFREGADSRDDLRVYDIGTPSAPRLLSALDLDFLAPWQMGHSFGFHRDHLYVSGVAVFDLSDSTRPTRTASLDDPAGAVAVTDRTLLVASDEPGGERVALRRYDLFDPARPRWFDSVGFAGEALELVPDGGRVYVAAGHGGLVVLGPPGETPPETRTPGPTPDPLVTPTRAPTHTAAPSETASPGSPTPSVSAPARVYLPILVRI